MMQTIRQMRELHSMDRSNETLRFNRTMDEAGLSGGFDDEGPTGAAVVWGFAALVIGFLLLVWWLGA